MLKPVSGAGRQHDNPGHPGMAVDNEAGIGSNRIDACSCVSTFSRDAPKAAPYMGIIHGLPLLGPNLSVKVLGTGERVSVGLRRHLHAIPVRKRGEAVAVIFRALSVEPDKCREPIGTEGSLVPDAVPKHHLPVERDGRPPIAEERRHPGTRGDDDLSGLVGFAVGDHANVAAEVMEVGDGLANPQLGPMRPCERQLRRNAALRIKNPPPGSRTVLISAERELRVAPRYGGGIHELMRDAEATSGRDRLAEEVGLTMHGGGPLTAQDQHAESN